MALGSFWEAFRFSTDTFMVATNWTKLYLDKFTFSIELLVKLNVLNKKWEKRRRWEKFWFPRRLIISNFHWKIVFTTFIGLIIVFGYIAIMERVCFYRKKFCLNGNFYFPSSFSYKLDKNGFIAKVSNFLKIFLIKNQHLCTFLTSVSKQLIIFVYLSFSCETPSWNPQNFSLRAPKLDQNVSWHQFEDFVLLNTFNEFTTSKNKKYNG